MSASRATDISQNLLGPSSDAIKKITADVEKTEKNYSSDLFFRDQEQTRSHIGKIFVRGFFGILILSSVGTLGYNLSIYFLTADKTLFVDIATIIPLVGSIIGTPLGFVMGYYFKDDGISSKISAPSDSGFL